MTDNIPDFIPVLSHGGHYSPEEGACVMEMVSYIAGEEWTDHPKCVADDLQRVARQVNDFVSDDNRSIIATMIPRFIGTEGLNASVSPMDNRRFNDLIGLKLKSHPELAPFIDTMRALPENVLSAIGRHFQKETDMNKRYTNEEYDKFSMTILEVMLDAADEVLVRGNYLVTLPEAYEKVSELPNQRKESNV